MLDWLLGNHYRYSQICSSGYDDSTVHTLIKAVLLLGLFTFVIPSIIFLNLFIYYSYIYPTIYKSFLFANVE